MCALAATRTCAGCRQMILLSAHDFPVAMIAELTFFKEDSVLYWLDRYESQGLSGLPALAARPGEDRPRTGRQPKSNWPM